MHGFRIRRAIIEIKYFIESLQGERLPQLGHNVLVGEHALLPHGILPGAGIDPLDPDEALAQLWVIGVPAHVRGLQGDLKDVHGRALDLHIEVVHVDRLRRHSANSDITMSPSRGTAAWNRSPYARTLEEALHCLAVFVPVSR